MTCQQTIDEETALAELMKATKYMGELNDIIRQTVENMEMTPRARRIALILLDQVKNRAGIVWREKLCAYWKAQKLNRPRNWQ